MAMTDFCAVNGQHQYNSNSFVADIPRGVPQPVLVQPSAVSTSSRIKSTTPNIALLFSLFDVLEDDNDDSGSSSSPYSPCSSVSPSSGRQTPEAASSPLMREPAGVPDVTYTNAIPIQWGPAAGRGYVGFYPDRISLLSNFADVLN
jgi:hypothetical protein